MRKTLPCVWVWGFMLCLVAMPSGAGPLGSVKETLLTITESTRAKVVASLARGDIAGAIVMYEAHTGRQAPAWLRNLQGAYSAANQIPGKCQEVARTIHMAFSQLGKSPEYIAFHSKQKNAYIVFDLPGGKEASVSRSGYHVAVKLEDMIHDAYTGPLGMKLSDYLARLHSIEGVTWKIATQP